VVRSAGPTRHSGQRPLAPLFRVSLLQTSRMLGSASPFRPKTRCLERLVADSLHEDGGDNRGGPAAVALQAVAAHASAIQRLSAEMAA